MKAKKWLQLKLQAPKNRTQCSSHNLNSISLCVYHCKQLWEKYSPTTVLIVFSLLLLQTVITILMLST